MARSLSPFVIVYNDQGQPLASQAVLDGQTPTPPMGVFDYVRQHGEERVSWQPVPGTTSNKDEKSVLNGGMILQRSHGVRIAAVIQRVAGPTPGFVLAGRNMREVEAREAQVGQLALLTWIGMMGVILVGTGAYGWWTRAPQLFASKEVLSASICPKGTISMPGSMAASFSVVTVELLRCNRVNTSDQLTALMAIKSS